MLYFRYDLKVDGMLYRMVPIRGKGGLMPPYKLAHIMEERPKELPTLRIYVVWTAKDYQSVDVPVEKVEVLRSYLMDGTKKPTDPNRIVRTAEYQPESKDWSVQVSWR